jgi:hypothetical protein
MSESCNFSSITSLLLNASAHDRLLDVICEELHQSPHWLPIFATAEEFDAVYSPSLFQTPSNQMMQPRYGLYGFLTVTDS